MKQHLREFDLIRAVAALSVFAIHISGRYVYSSKAAYVCNQSMRYAVPLFIIISGFLLFYSDVEKDKVDYKSFLTKRFKKVLIPYIIWSVIYVIYANRHNISVLWPITGTSASGLLRNLLFGNAAFHLYFVVIILQLYLIYIPLRSLLLKYPKTMLVISFVITLIFQTSIYLSQVKLLVLPGTPFPYFIMFPSWLFYFTFGMYGAHTMEKWCIRLQRKVVLLAMLSAASFIILFADSMLSSTFESSIKPSIMLYTVSCGLFLYAVSYSFKDNSSIAVKLLDWISAQSYAIYLSHILVLSLVVSLWKIVGLNGLLKPSVEMILLFLIILIFTLFFVYLVSLTPFASYLGGIPAKRRQPNADISSENAPKIRL